MNIIEGGVCAAKGFTANGIHAGIRKNKEKRDLSLILSECRAHAAAVYTTNLVKGAPLTVTAAAIVTEAPTAEPTAAPTAAPERSIKVTLKHDGDVIYYGDKVTLVAELVGYDDVPVTLQWLLNGEPVEGAVTLEYTFTVTPETVGAWQLAVTTPD